MTLWRRKTRGSGEAGFIDLSKFRVHGDAQARLGPGLSFVSPPGQWHYAVSVPCRAAERSVIEIETEITTGAVGFGLNDSSMSRYVSGEATSQAGDGRHLQHILLDLPIAETWLVARNVSPAGERSEGTIYRVEIYPLSKYSEAQLKQMRTNRYSYWHYSFDLGDGIASKARLPGVMETHRLNQDILFGLLDRGFSNSPGQEILDAACSSGFHSFALARRGSRVTAIDIDEPSIMQARFVQSCFADEAARGVRFEHTDLLAYSRQQPFPLFFCSGLFYHLRDLVGGAKKLYELSTEGGVVHSHVTEGDGEFMELANDRKFVCCFEGEFSFVPTANLLTRIFQYVGFRQVQMFKATELCRAEDIDNLLPHFAELYRRNTAYWILKKS